MSVVSGIATLLDAAGVGAYSPDAPLPANQTPITVAGFPKHSDLAVVVTTYPGGPEPDSRNGTEYPRLQVKVRSVNPLDALELDRQAFAVLQFTPGTDPVTLEDGEQLTDCYSVQSEAEPLGRDDNGRWEFTRNYQLTIQPAG